MKRNLRRGAALALMALGASLLTGCSNTTEVAEQTTTTSYGCDGAAGLQGIEALEPVGEECAVGEELTLSTPRDRYFDPMTQSWERPYPFGPYGTANWR